MKIEKTVDGDAAMLSLSGWLDSLAAPQLQAEIQTLEENITNLVLDFEGLEYISSAGLRQIVLAHKRMDGKGAVTLIRVPVAIQEVFRLAGLTERLTILT